MASQSFVCTSDITNSYSNIDVPPATANYENFFTNRASVALFNEKGSNKLIKIKNISLRPLGYAGTATPTLSVQKITAHGKGDATTNFPLDTNNAASPATVEIKTALTNVTIATGSFVRQSPMPNMLGGLALSMMSSMRKSPSYKWKSSSDLQKIVLRNGEGISIVSSGAFNTYPTPLIFTVTYRLSDTGACYIATGTTNFNFPYLATVLNNGYTAGQLEILDIRLEEHLSAGLIGGTGQTYPIFGFTLLDSQNISVNGTTYTPFSLDSSNTLNASVKLYKECDIKSKLSWQGCLGVNTYPMRVIMPSVPSTAPVLPNAFANTIFKAIDGISEIVLREGQGFALGLLTPGSVGQPMEAYFTFVQEDTGSGTFPAVGDVDSGVTYGPTGADYLGTLAQPAIANVKAGVQYGAGGTEFTGTLAGGGNIFVISD